VALLSIDYTKFIVEDFSEPTDSNRKIETGENCLDVPLKRIKSTRFKS